MGNYASCRRQGRGPPGTNMTLAGLGPAAGQHLAERHAPVGGGLPGQAEDALADAVALHLLAAAADGADPGAEPAQAVAPDRVIGTVQDALGARDLHGDLAEPEALQPGHQ